MNLGAERYLEWNSLGIRQMAQLLPCAYRSSYRYRLPNIPIEPTSHSNSYTSFYFCFSLFHQTFISLCLLWNCLLVNKFPYFLIVLHRTTSTVDTFWSIFLAHKSFIAPLLTHNGRLVATVLLYVSKIPLETSPNPLLPTGQIARVDFCYMQPETQLISYHLSLNWNLAFPWGYHFPCSPFK